MRERIFGVLAQRYKYVGGLLLLAAALLATHGMEAWKIHRLSETVEDRRAEVLRAARVTIERDFSRRIDELRTQAQRIAEHPVVSKSLRDLDGEERPEDLIRFAAKQRLPERFAFEIYDPGSRLLAWKGFSIPRGTSVRNAAQLDAGHTTIVQDQGVRWAIAVWWPVRHEGQTVGVVRTMRLVRFRASVQNQYIQDFSLERQWEIQTGFPVEVIWGESSPDASDGEGLLRAGKRILGHATVQPPAELQLFQSVRQRFANVEALWKTLLLFWLFGGCWMWYRRVDREEDNPSVVRRRATIRFLGVAAAWWALRYALVELDVPNRWQMGKAPLAPLFDPTHLASPIGGGVMESIGALLVTGCFALLFTIGFLDLAARFRVHAPSLEAFQERIRRARPTRSSVLVFLAAVVVAVLIQLGLVSVLASLARRAVLDSTLDFFARTGLLPNLLVLAVLCGLLLITVAVILCGAGTLWIAVWVLGRYRPAGWHLPQLVAVAVVTAGVTLVAASFGLGVGTDLPIWVTITYIGVVLGVALLGIVQGGGIVKHFTLRSLFPGLIVLTMLLYPMLYSGMATQRRGRMVDATMSFVEGSDPRVLFSLEHVLRRVRESSVVRQALTAERSWETVSQIDSVATELLRGSLMASLSQYETSLLLLDRAGGLRQSYATSGREATRGGGSRDVPSFQSLRARYAMRGDAEPVVVRLTDRRQQSRFQYAGLVAVSDTSGQETGWVMAHAEPRSLLPGTGTPYPRVLLPEGLYGDLYADLALAEFRDGTLVRSMGDFGRVQLSRAVHSILQDQPTTWRSQQINGRRYMIHYRREGAMPQTIVAARMPAITAFDHLYYLLRLVVAGLCIGIPFYVLGLYLRFRRGILPAPRVRFRDKMLDAFLVVGSIAVVIVGFIGARVIVSENERAVHNQLRQNLDRAEEALLLEARRGEMLYRTVERIRIDSLANRVGLDLNLYQDGRLIASSRPRLVRDRLIDVRLPVAAYQALYLDAYRFATSTERFGAFTYTMGFQALSDEGGQPRYVLAVPTLPEQERIQEERARTLAYLLGALLLLIVVIMVTAFFLSNALAQPLARLRAGLEAVGQGRYAQRLPVDTRDEIGELVHTFNAMREQLAASRRQLAQQEREMAWREMARQVAHEIKNPLTPMKLSVQHLRRAFQRRTVPETEGAAEGNGTPRFADLFDRITSTLIEQVDTLARIANEFSSFARLPERVFETLDLNEVVREAVSLMQEEATVAIELDLYDDPLVVKADREELRRIYINLIKNAIQAIPPHREGRIHVTTAPDGATSGAARQAQSWVRDNGVGIAPDQRGKIFQPNFSTKTSGTGLGLAIAHKTIDELDGEIGFRTEEGEGTTFWIYLPLAE